MYKRARGPSITAAAILVCSLAIQAQPSSRKGGMRALGELNAAVRELSELANPAVVEVLVTGYDPFEEGAFTGAGFATLRSGGSGVIVDPAGYIVTNAHVVEGANKVEVHLSPRPEPGVSFRSILKASGGLAGAQIVGIDSETDLAVLKIERTGLPALRFGDSDELHKGQLVLAFGSPRGLENSVTLGVVSSVARQIEPDGPVVYIQTDAPINPGNSGGPLISHNGEIIGINTFILSQSGGNEGIGFAVPSNIVKHVYDQIVKHGKVRRGVVGVEAQTITPTLAQGLGLDRSYGVILADVAPGGPASRAGLRVGDIVLKLDEKPMENARQFDVNLYRRAVGDRVSLEILRGKESLLLQVPVIERPDDYDRFSQMVTQERNLIRELGILAIDITPDVASLLPPARKLGGILVAARALDAPRANGASLRPGDVIFAVNRRNVTSLRNLRVALNDLGPDAAIVLQVQRGGILRYFPFRKE